MRRPSGAASRWLAALATTLVAAPLVAGAPSRDALLPLHEPPRLAEFERLVRLQYQRRRDAVDLALHDESASDASLAEAFGAFGMWAQVYSFNASADHAYRNARSLAPEDRRWHYYLGRYYRRTGDTEEARASFLRVLELSPGDVPSLVFLGELALEEGELTEAERRFQLALERDPACVRAMWGIGRVALQQGDAVRAVASLEQAVAEIPNEPAIHYSLGLAYRGVGDLDRAEKHLQIGTSPPKPVSKLPLMEDPLWRAVQKVKRSSKKHQQRARLALEAGRYDDAVRAYRRAVSASPETAGLRINLGSALLSAGRYDEAIVAYRKAIELDPDQPPAYFNLGLALRATGRSQEAIGMFREALAHDPRYGRAHVSLAIELSVRGDDEALGHLDRAVELEPGEPAYRQLRAEILLASGAHARAAAAIEADLRAAQAVPALRLLQARLLASARESELRDGARALALARKVSAGSASLAAAETIAMAHAEVGEFGPAASWQRAAAKAAAQSGRAAELGWVRERLALYEQGRPCREPWRLGEDAGAGIEVVRPAGAAEPAS